MRKVRRMVHASFRESSFEFAISFGHCAAQARAGVMPWRMGEPYPKAYEMTSIFEGLAEWHRVTGDEPAREAVLKYFDSVLRHEITIVGNGGGNYPHWPRWSGEAWDNTAAEQSNPDMTRMMETCVGVTWMKYASQCGRRTRSSSTSTTDCSAR